MWPFDSVKCPVCLRPITWWDRLTRNADYTETGLVLTHKTCPVEPKVGE